MHASSAHISAITNDCILDHSSRYNNRPVCSTYLGFGYATVILSLGDKVRKVQSKLQPTVRGKIQQDIDQESSRVVPEFSYKYLQHTKSRSGSQEKFIISRIDRESLIVAPVLFDK